MDTVSVYVSHSKNNIIFRRTVVVILIMIYLRRTVTPTTLNKPRLFAYTMHTYKMLLLVKK